MNSEDKYFALIIVATLAFILLCGAGSTVQEVLLQREKTRQMEIQQRAQK